MKIRRARARIKLGLSCLVALICVAGIIYSSYKIIEWRIDSNRTTDLSTAIESAANIAERDDDDKTEKPEVDTAGDNMYWKYLKTKLIEVDFSELKQINNETVGWIQVSGTNINYPFVQTTNNDYYLKHSFDKSYNSAGWVFADFRNKLDSSDRNQILYAHGRYDGTMFGTLRNILSSGWLNNADNFTVRTVNAHESVLWQVFSTYRIPVTSDYIQTDFTSNEEYGRFLGTLQGRSAHDFKVKLSARDRILTLSTCLNTNERVVLHARLIKRLQK